MNLKIRYNALALFAFFFASFSVLGLDPNLSSNKQNVDVKSKSKAIDFKLEKKESKDSEEAENEDGEKDDSKDISKKVLKKLPMVFPLGDSEIRAWVKLRLPEFFYGKNLNLLNNDNPGDRVLFFRHTIDLNSEYRYTRPGAYDVFFAKVNIRNKGVWGDPESMAKTTISGVKLHDSTFGQHSHAIPRHIMWIRELWVKLALNELLCLPFVNEHSVTLGAFPFELGRGISLGASYKVDPSDLGYYSEVAVDQYAFGGKLSGILSKVLMYDVYAAILDTKCASAAQTGAKIRGQEFGHRNNQARGFGSINYLVAAHLKYNAILHPKVRIQFEPYVLYNRNPEQRIEFLADAGGDLITIGLASESSVGNFEWGFDTAFNLGGQQIKGWDRNVIKIQNNKGFLVETNSKVKQISREEFERKGLDPNDPDLCEKVKSAALEVPENQSIIDVSEQSAEQNGKIIGENSFGILINDCDRFRSPYKNYFRGSMFIFDMGYYIMRPDLKISAVVAFASGDKDPNKDLECRGDAQVDTKYYGFIGLQETYSGTRVKSAFLLSGSGKVPRLLAFPSVRLANATPSNISRFSNLVFGGASAYWLPSWSAHKWNVNPNVLVYWQECPTTVCGHEGHDEHGHPTGEIEIKRYGISSFLGTEINVFVEAEVLAGLRFFGVSSVFLPGKHFSDIKGRPINEDQRKFLEKSNQTGIVNDKVPLLGDDAAYFANVGLEYKF